MTGELRPPPTAAQCVIEGDCRADCSSEEVGMLVLLVCRAAKASAPPAAAAAKQAAMHLRQQWQSACRVVFTIDASLRFLVRFSCCVALLRTNTSLSIVWLVWYGMLWWCRYAKSHAGWKQCDADQAADQTAAAEPPAHIKGLNEVARMPGRKNKAALLFSAYRPCGSNSHARLEVQ